MGDVFLKTKHKPQMICVQTLREVPFVKNSVFLIFILPSFVPIPIMEDSVGAK